MFIILYALKGLCEIYTVQDKTLLMPCITYFETKINIPLLLDLLI